MRMRRTAACAAAWMALWTAGAWAEEAAAGPEKTSLGGIERVHRMGPCYIASQPGEGDFQKIREAGVKSVVNVRAAGEVTAFDEKKVVEGLGMAYANPGFTPDTLDDAAFDAALAALHGADKPVLLHCSSANRAGAVWLVHRALDDGLSYEDALAEARAVGLTHPGLEAKAKAYVEARKKAEKAE
ncbi:MAG: hypothetical protein K8I02_06955 [Candidatus Methylomirabilis sp.]|nr:hypothetical protein [Deltaproteobacteria bacterium]